ncbi:MAG: carboxypeptidase-like regulatory domain-containing protein [Cyclobacteriaceae bacterium]|nr:carboxypeptidase-like regulatory domain-containing protein [Cyclobacteriaceae bacterium]MCH8514875.1 carboxypeptidase-like regulatory domain-containing protein [Cyclobacteriaceae bacterium]
MRIFRHFRLIALFCVFALSSTSLVEAYTLDDDDESKALIKGQVIDAKGNPVSFANVLLKHTTLGNYTDAEGFFNIRGLSAGDYTLRFSAVGYRSVEIAVSVKENEEQEVIVTFEEQVTTMPQITVLGNNTDRIFSKVPGSVSYIDNRELQLLQPISGNEALRRVAGVHVVDEEVLGMRVNVGIRGLDPSRSRSVLMLEDGIPVALAPYGEPEMYYTPAMDRMQGVEVLKGSGQVMFGPQTIGGVINYITADPPEETSGNVRIQAGEGGFFSGLARVGTSIGDNSGIVMDFLKKSGDAVGMTSFDITDFNTKIKLGLTDKSRLGIKLGIYNEESNSTYVGMTRGMWESGEFDFVPFAENDILRVQRYSVSTTYEYDLTPATTFKTTAFAYTTTRNWRREDFGYDDRSEDFPNQRVVGANTANPIFFRGTTGNRNRTFNVAGIEPQTETRYELAGKSSKLNAGARFLMEEALEQRINGTDVNTFSGDLVNDEIRTGRAISAYLQNKVDLTQKFSVSGGMRLEYFSFERDIQRLRGVDQDGTIIAQDDILTLIPGAGFNYNFNSRWTTFGGVHRGYAPPRTKDAITEVGEVVELDAEDSWNYELGIRANPTKGIFFEATAFYMDFSNQVIPVSEAAGGTGAGLINGGETLHAGLEGAGEINFGDVFDLPFNLILDANATWVRAEFQDNFLRGSGEQDIKGNRTPYAPEWFISSGLTFETRSGWAFRLTGNYVGEQFGDVENTIEIAANGRSGLIPSFFTLDANLMYNIKPINTTFNITVKNITDERYIASMRPQGIRAGLPRFITAGFNFRF